MGLSGESQQFLNVHHVHMTPQYVMRHNGYFPYAIRMLVEIHLGMDLEIL